MNILKRLKYCRDNVYPSLLVVSYEGTYVIWKNGEWRGNIYNQEGEKGRKIRKENKI